MSASIRSPYSNLPGAYRRMPTTLNSYTAPGRPLHPFERAMGLQTGSMNPGDWAANRAGQRGPGQQTNDALMAGGLAYGLKRFGDQPNSMSRGPERAPSTPRYNEVNASGTPWQTMNPMMTRADYDRQTAGQGGWTQNALTAGSFLDPRGPYSNQRPLPPPGPTSSYSSQYGTSVPNTGGSGKVGGVGGQLGAGGTAPGGVSSQAMTALPPPPPPGTPGVDAQGISALGVLGGIGGFLVGGPAGAIGGAAVGEELGGDSERKGKTPDQYRAEYYARMQNAGLDVMQNNDLQARRDQAIARLGQLQLDPQNQIDANNVMSAQQRAQAMRLAMEQGSRAGVSPEAMMGRTAEIQQRSQAQNLVANMQTKYQTQMANTDLTLKAIQAELAAAQDEIQNARDEKARKEAMAYQERLMIAQQEYNAQQAEIERSWQTETSLINTILGGALGVGGQAAGAYIMKG